MPTSPAITIPPPVADKLDSVPIIKPEGTLPNPQETKPNASEVTDEERYVSNPDLGKKLLKNELQSLHEELALYL